MKLHRPAPRAALLSLSGLLLAGALAGCGGGSGGDAGDSAGDSRDTSAFVPYAPTPDADAFYAPPSPLPDVAPGTLLNSRAVSFAPGGGLPLPPVSAWQLQYRSTDHNGRPIAAVATVVKPLIPALTGNTPLLSYQMAEDSLGMQCSPSHTVTGGTANNNAQAEALAYLPGLLAFGWTLVIPDHEGPYSAYAAGPLAGRITLDGIRAALQFQPLGLSPGQTPIGLWGYSGGAIATAWAANLQPHYAPELELTAVTAGGIPADIERSIKAFDSGLGNAVAFSLGMSAITGVTRAYPQALPESILNDKGRAAIAALKDGCTGNTTDGSPQPSGHFADYVSIDDPLNSPGARDTYARISLPQAGQAPSADLYLYQSQLDELIPVEGVDALVAAWCAAGTHIAYERGVAGEHIAYDVAGAPAALLYLESRLGGAPATVVPPTAQICN